MNRKPLMPEPSVFRRKKKKKLKIELPTMESRPAGPKMDIKGPDRCGGKHGKRD